MKSTNNKQTIKFEKQEIVISKEQARKELAEIKKSVRMLEIYLHSERDEQYNTLR